MTLSFNDYHWQLDPQADRERLRPILERFPRLEALSGAKILKRNRLRTVFFVPTPARAGDGDGDFDPTTPVPGESVDAAGGRPGVIAKVYRYPSAWARFCYRLRGTRARQEWFALHRFRELGLPTAAPLGIAKFGRGGRLEAEGLLLEYLVGCRSLVDALRPDREERAAGLTEGEFLATGNLSARQRALIELVARSVRTLHDRGAWHRDLHAGNLLLDSSGEKISFIDLHSCWFWSRLGRWQRRQGVRELLFSLSGTLPPEGMDAFLETYGVDALYGAVSKEALRGRVLRSIEARERTRLRSRSKRCFVSSTRFSVAREWSTRTYHLRELSRQELAALWKRDPPGRVLKRSERGWVSEAESGGRPVCVKYRAYTWLESLRSLVVSHRVRRAYGAGHALAVRKISSPGVIALYERRSMGCVREAHLVTEFIPEALPLDRYLQAEYWGRPALPAGASRYKHELARIVGRFVRDIHDANLYPHDLSPQNILVVQNRAVGGEGGRGEDGSAALYIVDLDELQICRRLSRRAREKNLVQVGNLPEGHISTADHLRGLKAYALGEAQYWNAPWIRRLRRSVLDEHLRVLLRRTERER